MTGVLKPLDLQALSIFFCIKVALVTDPARGMSGIPIEAIYHIRTVRPACGRIYGQETSCLVPCSIARLTCMKDAEA